MMKTIKAVKPYTFKSNVNFKVAPYYAWKQIGGKSLGSHYPLECLKGFFFHHEIPTIKKTTTEARLRFVEAFSVRFDTFPDYAIYEIVPFVWDCWPNEMDSFCEWLAKHNVQTSIFTCKETSNQIKKRFPKMNVMYCPEGIDSSAYNFGQDLRYRNIDLLEFGRGMEGLWKWNLPQNITHIKTMQNGRFMFSDDQLHNALADAKVTICLPHSYTDPKKAGGLETLTQRYWECMLSRVIILGHAPKELVDLIGYNPVLEIENFNKVNEIFIDIINNVDQYQELVNKNREIALQISDWKLRMKDVMAFLIKNSYKI